MEPTEHRKQEHREDKLIQKAFEINTNLLVKALKFPHTLPKIIYFIPPPQTN